MFRIFILIPAFLALCGSASAAILRISAGSNVRQLGSEVEANYTTTHLYVDEVAGDSIPIYLFFDPQTVNVESCEIFTNLNRRDRADDDANGDGIEDGIFPVNGNTIAAGNDEHYYKAHAMNLISGGFELVLNASKTGAYRLTARYRLNGDAPGTYRYYNDTDGGGKRDHAIVVSPTLARDVRMYEVNTLNIEASGTLFSQRSTFEDLSDRAGAIHTSPSRVNKWDLDYVKDLGVNWLWFQPYHPYGEEGRHLSAKNINDRAGNPNASNTWFWNGGPSGWYEDVNYAFQLGSPYAVRNFWEIDPRMSASFSGDPTSLTDLNNPANRASAMTAFKNFVADADTEGVNIMPDAAFNHTAWDVELGPGGIGAVKDGFDFDDRSWMAAQGASGWGAGDLIHDRELRVFSRAGDYRLRASFYTDFFNNNIAPAPDRTDFGKWLDVCDIFFGRYAALVGAQDGSEQNNYNAEGDWLDTTASDWNPTTQSGGSFDGFTRATWRYFAQYAPYWLHQTRPANQNRNSVPGDGDAATRHAWDARGIDGLRCDFGQGLPPQCWEYIINVARSYKWSFVFMAETLDGGAPPYRSNRHFDILNENILFAAKFSGSIFDFRSMFETRRAAFGQGLVLLNTVSHDEDNYADPWIALRNLAIFATNDGAPMVFPGQELGISTSPDGTAPGGQRNFGYDLYEKNFGKYVPHFKTHNSMMPLWEDDNYGNNQLYPVYAGILNARKNSPALRSSNRWFLDANNAIWAVAKYEEPNASPAFKDVVLGFVNFDRNNDQPATYAIPAGLAPLMGLKDGRTYNVKNIAAYTAQDPTRRDQFLWGSGITGAALKSSGFGVITRKVPDEPALWTAAPYEAQYLKVFDVTPPPAPTQPGSITMKAYSIGDQVTFDWEASPSNTADDNVTSYKLVIKEVGTDITVAEPVIDGATQHTFSGTFGQHLYAFVLPISAAGIEGSPSTASGSVKLLDPAADEDADGENNDAEDRAGTDPMDQASVFRVRSITHEGGANYRITWDSVPGKQYQLEANNTVSGAYTPVSGVITATGSSTNEVVTGSGSYQFFQVRLIEP